MGQSSLFGGNGGITTGSKPFLAHMIPAAENNLRLAPPEKFTGDPKRYHGFLNHCKLQFHCLPRTYASDQAKVGYVLSDRVDDAAVWTALYISQDSPILDDYTAFLTVFEEMFQGLTYAQASVSELCLCKQKDMDTIMYTTRFLQLASQTDTTDNTRSTLLRNGLIETSRTSSYACPIPRHLRTYGGRFCS